MNNRPKNYAKEKEEGYYTVYVKDNKVVVTKHKDKSPRAMAYGDKQEVVKCHPDDEFNMSTAIELGMNRVNMDDTIRVGDIVKVISEGNAYCTIQCWPDRYIGFAHRYRYGVCPTNGMKARVVGIYEMYDGNTAYIINSIEKEPMTTNSSRYSSLTVSDGIYVISRKGLKKIKE